MKWKLTFWKINSAERNQVASSEQMSETLSEIRRFLMGVELRNPPLQFLGMYSGQALIHVHQKQLHTNQVTENHPAIHQQKET